MTYEAFAIGAVRKAGEAIRAARQETFAVMHKGGDPRDIVTSVDKEVSELLMAEIQKTYPDHAVHSEEDEAVGGAGMYRWTIDPIDGSSNFARGIPHFAICLGLLENNVPIAAAIFNPVTDELFSFTKGEGARLNGASIRVSDVRDLSQAQALLSFGSRKRELWDWAAASYRKSLEFMLKRITLNSSSLDICFVAAGRADVCVYGTLTTLDVAPTLGLLYEAGGVACDAAGAAVSYSSAPQKVYLANNAAVLGQLRALFES